MWVAIARVKNEADIVEAFVRHTACHVDRMIILDHDSTDRTWSILTLLQAEGLPVELRRSTVFRSQGDDLTDLMRHAFADLGATWVVPLDADEFVECASGSALRESRRPDTGQALSVYWRNFMFVPADDEPDLFARMRWRADIPSELPKVIVPRSLGTDPTLSIAEGSHFLRGPQGYLAATPADDLVLCHFPIRSLEQYSLKVAVGTWRYIINASPDQDVWGWHYEPDYKLLLANKTDDLARRMQAESLNYSARQAGAQPVLGPLARLGGELRYTPATDTEDPFVSGLMRYAEGMARELAALKRRRSLPERIAQRIAGLRTLRSRAR